MPSEPCTDLFAHVKVLKQTLNKRVLSTCFIPGSMLDAGDTQVSKTSMVPALMREP